MSKIAIIVGSTRPGRKALDVARWVYGIASQRNDAQFDIVDIADYNLPIYDEPVPPAVGSYKHEHTQIWSEKIKGYDGYVFVTPEYNHSMSSALKNAIDYLYREWNDKAVGFVSYGSMGGTRAVEHLRQIAGELRMADVQAQVSLSLFHDFENFSVFKPGPKQEASVTNMLGQVITWSGALKVLRS